MPLRLPRPPLRPPPCNPAVAFVFAAFVGVFVVVVAVVVGGGGGPAVGVMIVISAIAIVSSGIVGPAVVVVVVVRSGRVSGEKNGDGGGGV